MDTNQHELNEIFSALSHPVRRTIIELVSVHERTVNELAEDLLNIYKETNDPDFDISRPATSQHLHILIDAKLIEQTRKGRIRMCSLNVKPLSTAFNWLVRYRIFWEDLLDKIQDHVETDSDNNEEKKL